ncbi:MAG: cobaltochelatase subunit CobN [Rikenellaceae bacterium]|jgi:cobaltochelatase CobN|nr:cobaltochelatase subunit CobN [Rikenellaceae bacterium]
MKRRLIVLAAAALVVAVALWLAWSMLAAPTRIALVDFQPFQRAGIVRANDDSFVKFEEVPLDRLHRLKRFDFVLGFGMGMRITSEQRAQIQRAASRGVPVYIHAATNPDNAICNLDSVQLRAVQSYLNNGSRRNYRNLARYVRAAIDHKSLFVGDAEPASPTASDVLYHLDDEQAFDDAAAYEKYLRDNKFYIEGGARVAIVGGLNDPFGGNRENLDSLIVSLMRAGINPYPVSSSSRRLEFLQQIGPDAVIYMPHGRLAMGRGDVAVEWLKERNIPLFSPLSLITTEDEWHADPRGLSGGFLSQSIVVPELDGAIYPYTLNIQERDRDGLYLFKAMPDRLRDFTQIIANFISLKRKSNADKRLAIYYFKGPGQATLAAQGLETVPSLYNLLQRLKKEGYRVENLPSDVRAFGRMLMEQGAVLSPYAEGAFDELLGRGKPALIEKTEYEQWVARSLPEELYADVVNTYGEAPGDYMSVQKNDGAYLAVARIELGNIVLLPQPMAALGGNSFAIVHGAKSAPPHTYIASYLWARHGFRADALLHFGTHGSLEFTPQRQVALGDTDWPDRLVGTTPHFYYYTIANVGEAMMAKRRSYATTLSYLTPAFRESDMRGQFGRLEERIREFHRSNSDRTAIEIRRMSVEMGLHRDLRLDSLLSKPCTEEEIDRLENFAEEIACEKIAGGLYTSSVAYAGDKVRSTVEAMSVDPIAYGVAKLDRLAGRASEEQHGNKSLFTQRYILPARALVGRLLAGAAATDELICSTAHISAAELAEVPAILAPPRRPVAAAAEREPSGQKAKSGGHPSWIPKTGRRPEPDKATVPAAEARSTPAQAPAPEYRPEQKARARAIAEVAQAIRNVAAYEKALKESPEAEFRSLLNALSGGYVAPSPGGDAVATPAAVPTGRNLYAINAETTPSEAAWERGVALAGSTLDEYRKQHGDWPRKVSYTFWSSEFIESEGTTIAQALYMLGVEPVRDSYGRVSDLQLIPAERLGRPRVDVVVQTSGQFRDLAASRLALLARAVEMAAAAGDEKDNRVVQSVVETERLLVEQGVSPKEARELSAQRIFGGVNGMYGTGIQDMVTSGDRWDDTQQIADTYIQNMGAVYGSGDTWGSYREGLLRAVLHNTDVVVQPRQSNTWGALSLDHVYEFMGGLNLAVRSVTGKDPEAYFADYRNRNNPRMQELREAIGVEARSTLFNPAYIREVVRGGASSAAQITEAVTNTYGWNVMKPSVIDNQLWDKLYEVYVLDGYRLGTEAFFRRENPQALQELSAVMLETARKGMWRASDEQLSTLARLHTDLVRDFGSAGAGFSGDNRLLQEFIAARVSPSAASTYRDELQRVRNAAPTANNGVVLKKDAVQEEGSRSSVGGRIVVPLVLVALAAAIVILRRKRKR